MDLPPFEPPTLHICNQEERTSHSEDIGIGERVEEGVERYRREETSEKEGEVNATSPWRASMLRISTPSSQIGGVRLRLKMANQNSTMRLHMFQWNM